MKDINYAGEDGAGRAMKKDQFNELITIRP
jgi:hypothetical protein